MHQGIEAGCECDTTYPFVRNVRTTVRMLALTLGVTARLVLLHLHRPLPYLIRLGRIRCVSGRGSTNYEWRGRDDVVFGNQKSAFGLKHSSNRSEQMSKERSTFVLKDRIYCCWKSPSHQSKNWSLFFFSRHPFSRHPFSTNARYPFLQKKIACRVCRGGERNRREMLSRNKVDCQRCKEDQKAQPREGREMKGWWTKAKKVG
jgi:hypothetical protein